MMALEVPADVLKRTPIYRMVHIECLATLVQREALHAPNCVPDDGLSYTGIHAADVQADRGDKAVACGPLGVINDYVGFYFGPRSPMLYRIHTGWNVRKVDQVNIVYLTSTAQAVANEGLGFVFTDRHSLAAVADFRDDIDDLSIVDFKMAYAERWNSTPEQPDRQEKKQAEFLVHQSMPWTLVDRIGVLNDTAKARVNEILGDYRSAHQPLVRRKGSWYY